MAQFQWTPDGDNVGSILYKNHWLSNQLKELASLEFQIAQFATPLDGAYGKQKGETVNVMHFKALTEPADPTIQELDDIPLQKLTAGWHSITVEEWGRGVSFTGKAKILSKYDPEDAHVKALKEQLRAVQDTQAALAAKTAMITAIPTSGTAITFDTDGTASTTAAANLSLAHLGIIRDYMTSTLHCPPLKGGDYVGLFTTKALRGLKSDTTYIQWQQYLKQSDLLYNSEVGRVEGMRLVEVTHEAALSNGVGTGNVTGEGLIFGDENIAIAEALSPHLRYEPNYGGKFGRFSAIAWYGILAYGIHWATANDREARIVRWGSA